MALTSRLLLMVGVCENDLPLQQLVMFSIIFHNCLKHC